MKNAHNALPKSVLIPLGLTAQASTVDEGNQRKIFESEMAT